MKNWGLSLLLLLLLLFGSRSQFHFSFFLWLFIDIAVLYTDVRMQLSYPQFHILMQTIWEVYTGSFMLSFTVPGIGVLRGSSCI